MEDKEKRKLYDQIIATGVQWLAYNHKINPGLCIVYEPKKINFKFLFKLVSIYSVYFGDFYIKCNILQYAYLFYFKKNRFLKRPPKYKVRYIDTDQFLEELAAHFEQSVNIFADIYNYYWS